MAKWVIGRDLTRSFTGEWSLEWRQEKTGKRTSAGKLWPEVSEILDDHILGDRPRRLIAVRYQECIGTNWLTLTEKAFAAKVPSLRFKEAIGIPLHDLRTLIADQLRSHAPESAANVIQTVLGHSTFEAGEAYRADCAGDLASQQWAEIRKEIGQC